MRSKMKDQRLHKTREESLECGGGSRPKHEASRTDGGAGTGKHKTCKTKRKEGYCKRYLDNVERKVKVKAS